MRRFIIPIPQEGVSLIPPQAVLVDGHLDYITDSDDDPVPDNAIYVSRVGAGEEVVEVDNTSGVLKHSHTFLGWAHPQAAKESVIESPLIDGGRDGIY
jgi:hypothetical protein